MSFNEFSKLSILGNEGHLDGDIWVCFKFLEAKSAGGRGSPEHDIT